MIRFQQLKYEIDPEYLFSPENGAGKHERAIAEELFKVNYSSNFDISRISRAGKSFITWENCYDRLNFIYNLCALGVITSPHRDDIFAGT